MFSKLFGKKPASSQNTKFFPESRVEALLMQAAQDLGARPEFYKELLVTDLFVLIVPGDRPSGSHIAREGELPHLIFSIQVDGDFSSIAADLGVVLESTLKAGQFADLVQYGQGSLDDYFKEQQPFFLR